MESLAKASGNVDELIAVKAMDLTSAYHYLEIAEILTAARRDDEALAWAERGQKAFPNLTDNRLRDFLVSVYLKRKRNNEALQLTWIQFEERPSLEHYKKLRKIAKQLNEWDEQRERALAWVNDVIAQNVKASNRWQAKPSRPNTSLRVEIALWEKNLEEAWAASQAGVCHQPLLIALAKKLEQNDRPDDAISLYRRVIPTIIEQGNNRAYAEAISLVKMVERVLIYQQRQQDFAVYRSELRTRYKAKRNFVKLLDGLAANLKP